MPLQTDKHNLSFRESFIGGSETASRRRWGRRVRRGSTKAWGPRTSAWGHTPSCLCCSGTNYANSTRTTDSPGHERLSVVKNRLLIMIPSDIYQISSHLMNVVLREEKGKSYRKICEGRTCFMHSIWITIQLSGNKYVPKWYWTLESYDYVLTGLMWDTGKRYTEISIKSILRGLFKLRQNGLSWNRQVEICISITNHFDLYHVLLVHIVICCTFQTVLHIYALIFMFDLVIVGAMDWFIVNCVYFRIML